MVLSFDYAYLTEDEQGHDGAEVEVKEHEKEVDESVGVEVLNGGVGTSVNTHLELANR